MQSSMFTGSSIDPTRISIVDSLRGFALMGLFLVHCSEYFELYWMNPTPSLVHDVVFFLFAGKAYAIFALLFGLSFFIIMDGKSKKGIDFSGRFLWRLVILFILGYLHCLIYSGDILQVIAVLGLSLLIVHRFSNLWIFGFSIAFLIGLPSIYHFYAALNNIPGANDQPVHWVLSGELFPILVNGTFWETVISNGWIGFQSKWYFYYESGRVFQLFGLFMWGLLLGKIGYFTNIKVYNKQSRYLFVVSLVGATILFLINIYLTHLPPGTIQKEGMASYYLSQWLDGYFCLFMVLIWVILFVFAFQTDIGHKILSYLAPLGRMSLTVYFLQSILCVPIFYGYGLGGYSFCNQTNSLLLGILLIVFQLILAHWWMKRFYYGPMEWIWRAATYLTTDIPFIKKI